MAQNEAVADGLSILGRVLALLEELRRSPVGTVIYDQIAHFVQEHEALQTRVDQVYGMLVHLLLDAYARDPNPENVTRINARLIQLRAAHAGAFAEVGAAAEAAAGPTPGPGGGLRESLPRQEPVPPSAPGGNETAATSPGVDKKENGDTTPPAADNGTQAERRVNTAYRLHLDRKRDEIEKLQGTLSHSIRDAISQNREFGALLKIELEALQQAEGAHEIENLRQILIGGIEELIQSQNLLDGKLHKTGDYLKLIRADSQRLRDELNKVRLLSLTDEFTGLPNRRAFMRQLQDEIGRSQRYGSPLALALLDLDEFKLINDVHGHATGDEVLRCYANQVLSILRHHDMVARYGGEEFAVLLPNTTLEGAMSAVTKVRQRSQEIFCEFGGKTLALPTFSTGLTMYMSGETPLVLIDRADRALYRAKSLGRNRTEVATTPAAEPSANPEVSQENGGA